jgi:hypothetical protein
MMFFTTSQPQIQPSTYQMGQMTPSQPSISIKWTYWRMMVWTSRILIGDMDGEWQDLGSEVGIMQAICWQHPGHKSNPAHTKWARWPHHNHQLASYGHIEGWWYGLAGYWSVIWMENGRIWAQKLG